MIDFTVPGLFVPERRRSFMAGGKNVPRRLVATRTKEVKEFMARVAFFASQHRPPGGPLLGGLALLIDLSLPRPASVSKKKRPWPEVKPDAENILKPVADALTGILYRDDAQICDLHVRKTYGIPQLRIRLWQLGELEE